MTQHEKRVDNHLDLRHTSINEQFDTGYITAIIRPRNETAFATSSGLPIRSIGTADTMLVLSCSICSSLCARPLKPGVSIGPGLMALTRILRCFSSTVQVRANDRIAALVAL